MCDVDDSPVARQGFIHNLRDVGFVVNHDNRFPFRRRPAPETVSW